MKILLVHNFYGEYGGEDSVVNSMVALLGEDNEVILFSRKSKDFMSALSKLRVMLGYSGKEAWRELQALIKKEQPDIIHVHNVFPVLTPYIYEMLFETGIPVVQTIHNFRFFCPNGLKLDRKGMLCKQEMSCSACVKSKCYNNSLLQSALYYKYMKYVRRHKILERLGGIFVLSEFMKSYVLSRIKRSDGLYIVPNCSASAKEKVPSCSRINSYYLYIGRLSREKGILTLLEAFRSIPAELKIAGMGPMENEIMQYVEKHNMTNVEVVGFVSGEVKSKLISNAKVLVVPSEWYEQFGITAVEALAAGVPVIVSEMGGLASIVKEGVNGFIFEAGVVSNLYEKVMYLNQMQDKQYSSLCENAYLSWEETYTPEKFTLRTVEVYKNILKKKEDNECKTL